MTYTIPSPANATYVAKTTGRDDTIHNEVGSLIEEPKFVDNAIHHAIYEKANIGDIKLISYQPTKGNISIPKETHLFA